MDKYVGLYYDTLFIFQEREQQMLGRMDTLEKRLLDLQEKGSSKKANYRYNIFRCLDLKMDAPIKNTPKSLLA